MYLLDTDHLSILQMRYQPAHARLTARMSQHPASSFFRSIISFDEQVLGVHSYLSQAQTIAALVHGYALLDVIRADYASAQVLPFGSAAANLADSFKLNVGTNDLRIASIALAKNLTVLTGNLRDFRKVPGLQSEDWTH